MQHSEHTGYAVTWIRSPLIPRRGGAHRLGGPRNVHNAKMCCGFFRIGFSSDDRRQPSDVCYSQLVTGKESGKKKMVCDICKHC
jgi:hypothetical protein